MGGSRLFADRYHDHLLRTPRKVRRALAYVLNKGLRHGARFWLRIRGARGAREVPGAGPYASGEWFDEWRERPPPRGGGEVPRPVAEARTWLVTAGWRRHGLLGLTEVARGT